MAEASLTEDQVQDLNAALDGLLEGVMDKWNDTATALRPIDRALSAYAFISEHLFGMCGQRMISLVGTEKSASVALNLIERDAYRIGQCVAHMPSGYAMTALMKASQVMVASANNPEPI